MQKEGEECVFCTIAGKKCATTRIEYEDDQIMVFKDIRPVSDYHFLAIPKNHIKDAKSLRNEHKPLLQAMQRALENLLEEKGIDPAERRLGFHWPPFTRINHLHLHGMGPVSKIGFLGRLIFKPNNKWFCSVENVENSIPADDQEPKSSL